MKTLYNILTLTACLLLAFGCKDSATSPEPKPDPNVASKQIGTAGGEIASKDGELKLTIPAGALGNTETITITPITADELGNEFGEIASEIGIAEAYELEPDGLQFDKPVTVTFPSEQKALQEDGSLKLNAEFLFTSEQGKATTLDSLRLEPAGEDTDAMQISGELSHFSPAVVTKLGGLIKAEITGLPDEMVIGQTAEYHIVVQVDEVLKVDQVKTLSEIFVKTEPGVFEYTGIVECTEEGPLVLRKHIRVDFGNHPYFKEDYSFTYIDVINCVKPDEELIIEDFILISDLPLGGKLKAEIKYGKPLAEIDINVEWGDGTSITITDMVNEEGTLPIEEKHTYETDGEYEVKLSAEDPETGAKAEVKGILRTDIELDKLPEGVKEVVGDIAFNGWEGIARLFFPPLPDNKISKHQNRYTNRQQQADESIFGNLIGAYPVAITGAEGILVVDLLTNEVLLEATDIGATGPFFGAIGLIGDKNNPGGEAQIVAFGKNGTEVINAGGVAPGYSISDNTVYDALPADGSMAAGFYTLVSPDLGVQFSITFSAFRNSTYDISQTAFEGEVVSAWAPDIDLVFEGPPVPVLIIDRAVESGLYYKPDIQNTAGPLKRIADLGLDARKIRCIATNESGYICGITIFGDDEIAIVAWDGASEPVVAGTAPAGDGPVDLSLTRLENGNVAIVTTGFNDNTVTETEVSPDGSVVSNVTRAVLDGCINPGHAIYVRDGEGLKIVGTCYTSSNYFIMKSGL